MGEQEPFSYRTTSEHPLTTSSLATLRGRSQMAQGTWHPGPLLRTQGTGGRAWDCCGDSCALLASPTRWPTSRVTREQRLGCQPARVPTWGGTSSSAKPVPRGPVERLGLEPPPKPDLWPQGERHSAPRPSRSPRAMSCSHSPQLPSPDGRREVPSAPLPAPPTLRTARSSHSASGALTGRWKRPQAARAPTSPTNSCRRRVTPIPLSAERALLSCGRTVPGHAPCGTRFLRMLQGQSFSFLCAQVPTSLVHGISRLLCARARRASPLLDCAGPPDMGSAKPHLLRVRRGWSLPAFLRTCGASPSPERAQRALPPPFLRAQRGDPWKRSCLSGPSLPLARAAQAPLS